VLLLALFLFTLLALFDGTPRLASIGTAGRIAASIAAWTLSCLLIGVLRLLLWRAVPGRMQASRSRGGVWRPPYSIRVSLDGAALGLVAGAAFIVIGGWLARARIPGSDVPFLLGAVTAQIVGAWLCMRGARLRVAKEPSGLLLRELFRTRFAPWESIERFEVVPGRLWARIRILFRAGNTWSIQMADPRVSEFPGQEELASVVEELNAMLGGVAVNRVTDGG
jgi:hypothetical protein